MLGYNFKENDMSINKMLCTCSFIILLVSGCSTQKTNEWFVSHNGNMPTGERVSQIKVGDSRDDVRQVLGSPSVVVAFDKNTWLYMSSDIKKVAFFAPEEVDRDVLAIRFSDNGRITEIDHLTLADGEKVKIVSDTTPSYGQKQGFFRRYFGGVGQYNPFGGMGGSRF